MVNILVILLASSFAGFLGAITGLGGGSIMVPFLVATGVPVKHAIANSMITIIATSSGSASAYVRERLTNIKAAMYLEIFTVTGAIIGAYIALFAPSRYLYFFFAVFLMSSFYGIRHEMGNEILENKVQDRFSKWLELEGSYFDESVGREIKYKMTNAVLGGLGMIIAGLAAGMLGIGAGAFKVAIHELVLKMPSKVSSSTSNFIIGMTALAGSSVFIASGFINLSLAAPMAIGTTLGSLAGTRILNKLSNRTVRLLFIVVLAYLIVQMIYKGVVSLAS
ncbi:MAG TPA: sulfite exporter TauE/SafE family protein [Candidatus Korarchaeota archaeon]|nr:sulfite exporter TauE/SafE family protein [Candidatus Korarchaeota archaeon]